MALNWDLSKIADWENVCEIDAPEDRPMDGIKKGDRIMSPVTNTLIWATLSVGIGVITDENYPEFYARLHISELMCGAHLTVWKDDKPQSRYITLNEVKAHIGLRTNVFPKRPDGEFLRQVMSEMMRPIEPIDWKAIDGVSEDDDDEDEYTFDEAQDRFRAAPSRETAAIYKREAIAYEADEMIGPDTFAAAMAELLPYVSSDHD